MVLELRSRGRLPAVHPVCRRPDRWACPGPREPGWTANSGPTTPGRHAPPRGDPPAGFARVDCRRDERPPQHQLPRPVATPPESERPRRRLLVLSLASNETSTRVLGIPHGVISPAV